MTRLTFLLAGSLALTLASQAYAQDKPTVPLIATGGTIAMKIVPVKKAPVPAISGEDLMATVPGVGEYANIVVKNLQNVRADYMNAEHLVGLIRAVGDALQRPQRPGLLVSSCTSA